MQENISGQGVGRSHEMKRLVIKKWLSSLKSLTGLNQFQKLIDDDNKEDATVLIDMLAKVSSYHNISSQELNMVLENGIVYAKYGDFIGLYPKILAQWIVKYVATRPIKHGSKETPIPSATKEESAKWIKEFYRLANMDFSVDRKEKTPEDAHNKRNKEKS